VKNQGQLYACCIRGPAACCWTRTERLDRSAGSDRVDYLGDPTAVLGCFVASCYATDRADPPPPPRRRIGDDQQDWDDQPLPLVPASPPLISPEQWSSRITWRGTASRPAGAGRPRSWGVVGVLVSGHPPARWAWRGKTGPICQRRSVQAVTPKQKTARSRGTGLEGRPVTGRRRRIVRLQGRTV